MSSRIVRIVVVTVTIGVGLAILWSLYSALGFAKTADKTADEAKTVAVRTEGNLKTLTARVGGIGTRIGEIDKKFDDVATKDDLVKWNAWATEMNKSVATKEDLAKLDQKVNGINETLTKMSEPPELPQYTIKTSELLKSLGSSDSKVAAESAYSLIGRDEEVEKIVRYYASSENSVLKRRAKLVLDEMKEATRRFRDKVLSNPRDFDSEVVVAVRELLPTLPTEPAKAKKAPTAAKKSAATKAKAPSAMPAARPKAAPAPPVPTTAKSGVAMVPPQQIVIRVVVDQQQPLPARTSILSNVVRSPYTGPYENWRMNSR